MKKLIKSSFLFIALFSTIFVIVSLTQGCSSKKDVMLVETVLLGDYSGVYVYHNDKPTEFIKTELSEKMKIENSEKLQITLQKLYNDGWRLEETNDGNSVQRYILTK